MSYKWADDRADEMERRDAASDGRRRLWNACSQCGVVILRKEAIWRSPDGKPLCQEHAARLFGSVPWYETQRRPGPSEVK